MMTTWNPRDRLWLFGMTVAVCLLFTGGRIASSDENVFFLETRSLIENGTLAIPEGIVDNGVRGADGRYYVGAGIGYTMLSIPFYMIGKCFIWITNPPDHLHILILKSAFSLTNQFLAGILAVVMFGLARQLGYSRRVALLVTAAILFTTNIFPYTKAATRDIATTLCFVGALNALLAYKRTERSRYLHQAGAWLAWLLTLKISFVIVIPCFSMYVALIHYERDALPLGSWIRQKGRQLVKPLITVLAWTTLGLGIVFLYQTALFGNPFASGYSERDAASFSTPLFVGLYGLLLSSGKSFFLYAPVSILFFAALRKFRSRFWPELVLIVSVAVVMIVFHAKFFSWAADGSWGPRYLIPIIPLIVVPVGIQFDNRLIRRWFWALAILGSVIQFGGSAVYLGSYLRYLGEFPFTRSFQDPEFMVKSHFVPNYSPVVGHWALLAESIEEHRAGRMGSFEIHSGNARLPVSESDRTRLIHVIDFWFMYAYYAGLRPLWCAVAALGFAAVVLFIVGAGVRHFLRE